MAKEMGSPSMHTITKYVELSQVHKKRQLEHMILQQLNIEESMQ